MKSFAPKPWFAPQPVLIIGTYNKEGVANAMNAAWAGQWDMKEIMISMGNHVTTDNLKLGGEFTVAFATKNIDDFSNEIIAGFAFVILLLDAALQGHREIGEHRRSEERRVGKECLS